MPVISLPGGAIARVDTLVSQAPDLRYRLTHQGWRRIKDWIQRLQPNFTLSREDCERKRRHIGEMAMIKGVPFEYEILDYTKEDFPTVRILVTPKDFGRKEERLRPVGTKLLAYPGHFNKNTPNGMRPT